MRSTARPNPPDRPVVAKDHSVAVINAGSWQRRPPQPLFEQAVEGHSRGAHHLDKS